MSRAGFAIAIAGCLAWGAALGAFVYLVSTGAARMALGIAGCFSPCVAMIAFEAGRASR